MVLRLSKYGELVLVLCFSRRRSLLYSVSSSFNPTRKEDELEALHDCGLGRGDALRGYLLDYYAQPTVTRITPCRSRGSHNGLPSSPLRPSDSGRRSGNPRTYDPLVAFQRLHLSCTGSKVEGQLNCDKLAMSEASTSISQRRHPYLPGLWLAAGFGSRELSVYLEALGRNPRDSHRSSRKSSFGKNI